MDPIRLIRPTMAYADGIMAYRQAFLNAGDDMDGCGNLRECATAKEWIDMINMLSDPASCPSDRVPSDSYLAVREKDNRIVGMIDLRHHIDHPILGTWGGHIGYSVHPDERKKGYATEMLRQNLNNCRSLGLAKVLLTCSADNIASEKTILANGGVFESLIQVEDEIIKRFWIEL